MARFDLLISWMPDERRIHWTETMIGIRIINELYISKKTRVLTESDEQGSEADGKACDDHKR